MKKVKKIEFVESITNSKTYYSFFNCNFIKIKYTISKKFNDTSFILQINYYKEHKFDSVQEAIDFAQSDYEKRVYDIFFND
jgi:hypothetical protein